jgi:hypothetical protein
VKRGLDEPALPEVGGALAGQQPVAQRLLRAFESPPLVERRGVGDQHVLDARRVAQHEDVLSSDAEVGEGSVACDFLEKPERIAPHATERRPWQGEPGARGGGRRHAAIL